MKFKQLRKRFTPRLVLTLLLASLVVVSSVKAAYWVYSNIVSEQVGYTLSLSKLRVGDTETLTALLTDTSQNPITSTPIHFYQCTDGGTIISELAGSPANTNSTGHAVITYTFISDGTYYFKAGYQVD